MSKKAIISTFLIAVVLIVGFGILVKYKPDIDRIKSAITISDSMFARGDKNTDFVSIYSDIHHMSHNVVIADDKWGYKDLTIENIEKLIEKVTKIEDNADNSDEKKEVLKILRRWKGGDFSSVHHDHNYVWAKLGGTVGRARGINIKNLPDWAVK